MPIFAGNMQKLPAYFVKKTCLVYLDRICENNILVNSVFFALPYRFSIKAKRFPTFFEHLQLQQRVFVPLMLITALFPFGCSQPASLSSRGWPNRLELCEFPEVLGGCCESKLILYAVWAA